MFKLNKIIVFIYFLTFFVLGYSLSEFNHNINVKKSFNAVEEVDINNNKQLSDIFLDKSLDLTLFWRTYNLVKLNYFDIEGLKDQDLIDGITDGLIKSLGDKHSEFMTPDITKSFKDNLTGDFEGIGAVINKNELGVEIDRILKGSPSEKFGLYKGDIIIMAGEFTLKGLTLGDAVDKIKGPAGTKVILKILREGESDFLIIEVTRDKIKIPSVESEILENNIGYISVNMFGELTSNDFNGILNELIDKNIDGLIVDLRNNGGGYLDSSVTILSNFIEKGKKLLTTKYRDSLMNREYFSSNNGFVFNKKIVVLINSNSASASEITAGALQDYEKAIIVGEKSYGKGSVQSPFDLGNGNLLKLTIAKWFTPKDKNIDGEGITPNIEVKVKKEDYSFDECIKVGKCTDTMKEDDFEFYDRQLEEAKIILNSYIINDIYQLTIDEYHKKNNLIGTGSLN